MEYISRSDFLDEVHRARAEYDAIRARIPEDRMTEPGVIGNWSVKDVIAHVMWSEREMVGVLKQRWRCCTFRWHKLDGLQHCQLRVTEQSRICYRD